LFALGLSGQIRAWFNATWRMLSRFGKNTASDHHDCNTSDTRGGFFKTLQFFLVTFFVQVSGSDVYD